MINGFVWLERGMRLEEQEKLVALAERDNHGLFFPTFTVRKAGEPVGWVSVNGVPFAFAHLGMKELSPRDSFGVINAVENHVALGGAAGIVWPVPKTSPFHELMPGLGYTSLGEYELFFKKL